MALETQALDGVSYAVLDNPPLNILTRDTLGDLRTALTRLRRDTTLRVLVLSARGNHFSAGADVAEHLPPACRDLIPEFMQTVNALADFPVPVVAAVQGRCLGGGFELALAADLIVAAESASFGQPEIGLAVFPPAACALLPSRCSWGVAAELVFTGDPLTAQQAREAGLVRYVVPDAELEAVAMQLAARMARHSAAALRLAKRCLLDGEAREGRLARAARLYLNDLMNTEDAVAGLTGFLEKRRPVWRHQ